MHRLPGAAVNSALLVALCVVDLPPAIAAPIATGTPELHAGQMPQALVLDGLLDETAWREADAISGLTLIEPVEGGTPTQATTVRVLAGAHAVVIGVECRDDRPADLVSYSKARDAPLDREDHVRIVLDTFRDGRSGYVFSVNPSGARYDALVSDRGEGESSQWDEAWEAVTRVGPEGWSAEIRIPIRSLRFREGLAAWGFNVERRVERLQEVSRWAGASRDYALTQTSRAGLLEGLPAFDRGLGLTVRPSAVVGYGRRSSAEADEAELDGSFDASQLVGAGGLLSLTANTDFAETEVDVRQTNLTRFPLFFPEKRSFFLEGADIFDFGLGLGTDLIPFFSRRVGLVAGQEVPLDVGTKLSGRFGRTNVGALAVRTGSVPGLVEATEMGVVRVQQNVLRESSVGILATAGDPLDRSGAWLAGADFTYQTSRFLGDDNFLVGVWGLGSGRDDAGEDAAWGLKVDFPNDPLDTALTYKRIGEDFVAPIGFVPRRGVQIVTPKADYLLRPDWPWLRNMIFETSLTLVTDLGGEWESYRLFTAPVNLRFETGDRFELNAVPEGDRPEEPFEVADGVIIPPGRYEWTRYRIEGDLAPKRPVSGRLTWWFGRFYDGDLDQYQVTLRWNPSALVNVELASERNEGRLPAGRFVTDLASLRVALNLSPDLQVTSLVQWDSESRSLGSFLRLRWTFHPLGDLFLVHNYNAVDRRVEGGIDRRSRFETDGNILELKVRHAWRW